MKEHRVIAFCYLTIHPIGFLASGKKIFFRKKFFQSRITCWIFLRVCPCGRNNTWCCWTWSTFLRASRCGCNNTWCCRTSGICRQVDRCRCNNTWYCHSSVPVPRPCRSGCNNRSFSPRSNRRWFCNDLELVPCRRTPPTEPALQSVFSCIRPPEKNSTVYHNIRFHFEKTNAFLKKREKKSPSRRTNCFIHCLSLPVFHGYRLFYRGHKSPDPESASDFPERFCRKVFFWRFLSHPG